MKHVEVLKLGFASCLHALSVVEGSGICSCFNQYRASDKVTLFRQETYELVDLLNI